MQHIDYFAGFVHWIGTANEKKQIEEEKLSFENKQPQRENEIYTCFLSNMHSVKKAVDISLCCRASVFDIIKPFRIRILNTNEEYRKKTSIQHVNDEKTQKTKAANICVSI